MFEVLFLAAVSIYFIQTVIFIIGINKKYKKVNDENLPSASVIVAARNEEANIKECMESLDKLVYPEGKIEIIIVDDHSNDSTNRIVTDYISDKPKFKCLIPSKAIGSLKGKANAIANAIEIAEGEIILTTDADCIVSPYWAKTLASYYQPDVAMVCGYTNQDESDPFSAMQSVDFVYLLGVAAGAMNLNKPLSCIGNNMSYRKSVYNEIGGYQSLPFSVTEDFNLLMKIHSLNKYKIIYPLDANGLVTSKACDSVKSLYWQKKRWGVGGLESDIAGFGVMASGFLVHVFMLLIPFFFSVQALYLLIFKVIIDYLMVRYLYSRLNLKLRIKYFFVFELYFIIYVILLPITLLFSKKVRWKGREYK
jgi:cellulose synthase/poly-beta-1,6-N-acetylglucosamine synthase-like glycosyltransferase